MKNSRFTSSLGCGFFACALAIGTIASTQPASAQDHTALAEVTIPFSFQTANQKLPAGLYRIERESPNMVLLEGPHHTTGFVLMNSAIKLNAAGHGSIVFDHTGNQYFLRQIWTAGSTTGYECPKSRAEKESLQAKNKEVPTSTELAFNSVPKR